MHPMELLDELYHMESRFNLFGDSLGARLVHGLRIMHHIGSENIMEAPDNTPR